MTDSRVKGQEVFMAAMIGGSSVFAAGVASAVAVGLQESQGHWFANAVAALALGLPYVLIFATVLALILSLPSSLCWWGLVHRLRGRGVDASRSAQIAMLATTLLAFFAICVVSGETPTAIKVFCWLVVPAALSWMLAGQFFSHASLSVDARHPPRSVM